MMKWWDSDETASAGEAPPSETQFVLHVENGKIHKVDGSIKTAKLTGCMEVLEGSSESGWIAGITCEGRRRLRFSPDFSEETKQRIRNVIINL